MEDKIVKIERTKKETYGYEVELVTMIYESGTKITRFIPRKINENGEAEQQSLLFMKIGDDTDGKIQE